MATGARAPSCELVVRVTPRAQADEIAGQREGVWLVRVKAPPVDGAANAAVCRLIAKRVGVGVRSVTVLCGAGSREKLMRVEGASADAVARALAGARRPASG